MRIRIVFILFLCCCVQVGWTQNELSAPIIQKPQEQINEEDEDQAVSDVDDNYQGDSTNEDEEYEDESYEERPEWDLRTVDQKKWTKLKKDKRFIYKKEIPKERKTRKKRNYNFADFLNSGLFKFILYALFGLFILYIIYLFIKNNDISFRRNIKDEVIVKEEPWENVRSFDAWELALEKAIKDRDYRLATRIYYLHILSILNARSLIRFQEDKTNWYYVQKLFGTSYHNDFMELTKSFDYIWYGEYEITKAQFEQLQSQFKAFHYKVG